MNCGIYKITNLVNGKVYIGQGVDFGKRKNSHFSDLKLNKHGNLHLQNAYNKYGKDNFIFEKIESILFLLEGNEEYYCEREQFWMDEYKSLDRRYGYNLQRAFPVQCPSKETIERSSDLTWEQIKEIRRLYNEENFSVKKLVKNFGVKETAIGNIISNNSWYDENYKYIPRDYSGENNLQAKLIWAQVKEIRELYATDKYFQKDLAKNFGVSQRLIGCVVNNLIWKEDDYIPFKKKRVQTKETRQKLSRAKIGENNSKSKLTWSKAKEIRKLYKMGQYRYIDLAKVFNISSGVIQRIVENKSWIDKNYVFTKREGYNVGENHSQSKLTWEQVREIRELHKTDKYSQEQLMRRFNIKNIKDIITGKSWKDENYVSHKRKYSIAGEKAGPAKLTWEKVREIRRLYKRGGIPQSKIALMFGVSSSCVQHILKNRVWKEVTSGNTLKIQPNKEK